MTSKSGSGSTFDQETLTGAAASSDESEKNKPAGNGNDEKSDDDDDGKDKTIQSELDEAEAKKDDYEPDTEDSTAGDIHAGEGSDLPGHGGATREEASTAATMTMEGPSQPHLEADSFDDETDEDHPMKVKTTEGQDADAVQDRIEEEIDGLARSSGEDDTLRTGDGVPSYAPPGSRNAAVQGVQQDASGHYESVAHVKSPKSGTRV